MEASVTEETPETHPQSPVPPKSPAQNRRRIAAILGAVAVLVAALVYGFITIDRLGWEFFNKGSEILITLSRTAAAARAGDTEALRLHYSSNYSGQTLGLNSRTLIDERDGIRVYAFGQTPEKATRQDAMSEWRTYLDGFSEVEEVGLYIHRLER